MPRLGAVHAAGERLPCENEVVGVRVVPAQDHGELRVVQIVRLWRPEKIDIGGGHERPPWLWEVGHRERRERAREGLHAMVVF